MRPRTFSQYGEDLIAGAVLLGQTGCAVEIGAGDGQHLSNTALFRDRGWLNVLIEPDPVYKAVLQALESPFVKVIHEAATPENINELVPSTTDLLSIDVDGDDIFLLEALEHRPKVIIVEYNPTMPRDIDVRPSRLGLRIGASVEALMRVAGEMGYGLWELTECNAIFVYGETHADFEVEDPAYFVATEYFTGRPLIIGTPPWGIDFSNPFPMEDVIIR